MQLIQSNNKTMSSREIAHITGKRHSDVLRDIRKMLKELDINERNFASVYIAGNNEEKPQFDLNQNLSVTLVSGYSVSMRFAIIERWDELEQKQAETPEQLMARALISAQSVIDDKSRQLEQAKPAIELHETIVNDDHTLCMRDAAKKLQVKPNKFMEWLRQAKYITASNMAYQSKIDAGYMVLSTTEHNGKPRTSTRITGKGFAHFGKKMAELRFSNPSHDVFYKG